MNGRDPNGSGAIVLGTELDFLPRLTLDKQPDPSGPAVGAGAAYSPDRGVLDLLQASTGRRQRRLTGHVVDADGASYLVAEGRLVVEDCAGGRRPFPCEPGVLVEPAGMALDRRGFLLVADRRARVVVVFSTHDGRVEARLTDSEMREPVDVALAPDGTIFVVDRGGDFLGLQPGRIVAFDSRFERRRSWIPRNDATPPRPTRSRPIALFWRPTAAGGEVVVVDEGHPRLLAFGTDGEPIGEREVADLLADVETDGAGSADLIRLGLAQRIGVCGCPPDLDIGHALADWHRALRLREVRLHRTFRRCGRWISAVLDSGTPGTSWHRLELDVVLPPKTSVRVDTATSDDIAALVDVRDDVVGGATPAQPGCPAPVAPDADQVTWTVLRDRSGMPVEFSGDAPRVPAPAFRYDIATTSALVREQLVQAPPGRFLRLRLELHGDGSSTPSVKSIRVVAPRRSYLDLLPAVFAQNPDAESFLDGYLSLFERRFTSLEAVRDDFYRTLSPAAAPPDVLRWLAGLLDLTFDPSWPIARRRQLLAEAMDLYRRRGTPAGLARYIEVYTEIRPVITEDFRSRPAAPATAGRSGVVGTSFGIGLAPSTGAPPSDALMAAYAHRFTVHLPIADPCDRPVVLPVVDRIITTNKPAHTEHRLRVIDTDSRLDDDALVGVDTVLGARRAQRTQLRSEGPRPVLGHDTVLGPGSRARNPDPTI